MPIFTKPCDDLKSFWLQMAKLPWRRLEFVTIERKSNSQGTYKKHTYLTPMDNWAVTFYAGLAVYVKWEGSNGVRIKYSKALGLITYEGLDDQRYKYFN